MEVRKGYKQTEVGIIPEDWDIRPLGSVVTFLDGQRRPVKDSDRAKMRGEIPYYGASGIVDYVNDYLFDDDLILLGEDGENIVSRNTRLAFRVYGKIWVNNHAHVLKPLPHISIGYLTDFLESLNYESYNSGTAQPKLNKQTCYKISVALPPTLAEQEAIAEALSDADALIESLESLLAKKRQVKQGAMSELPSGKRRVVESGEWEETSLGELGKIYRGVSYNPSNDLSSSDTDTTVRLLRSNNVQESTVVFSDMQYVGVDKVSKDQIMQKNDVLICMANGSKSLVGKAGRFSNEDGYKYTFGAFMGCFRPNVQAVNPDFSFYLFLTEQYRSHIAILLAGSSINNLTPSNVEAFTIKIPVDLAEQSAIAEILNDMDAEITALEAKLSKARDVKAGMMSELLTGRVRFAP